MKKILSLMALAMMIVSLQSCLHDDDEVFSESASVRIQKAVDEVKAKLTSSPNGWTMHYFTGEDYTGGGYNMLVRFDHNYAYVSADFAPADSVSRSTWDVKKDQGPVLTFDTHNELMHAKSEPSSGAIDGEEGDYEFVVLRMTEDSIFVRGKKWNNHMVMVRNAENMNWEQYISGVQKTLDNLVVKYETPAGTSIKINTNSRRITTADDGIGTPFYATANGLQFVEPYEIDGVMVSGFDFDSSTNVLSSAALGGEIKAVVDPLSQQLTEGDWIITYENVGPFGKTYFDAADNKLLATEGESLLYACLSKGTFVNSKYTEAWGFSFITDAGYGGQLTMSTTILADDKIQMQFAMLGQGDGVYYHNNCGFNYYLNVFGYSSARTFILTADNVIKPSEITLTEESNPNNWIKVIAALQTYK